MANLRVPAAIVMAILPSGSVTHYHAADEEEERATLQRCKQIPGCVTYVYVPEAESVRRMSIAR